MFKKVNPTEEINKRINEDQELSVIVDYYRQYYRLVIEAVEKRKEIGLSQSQVAERSGLTQQMVSRIEKGVNSPSIDTLMRYLNAVGLRLRIDHDEECCTI